MKYYFHLRYKILIRYFEDLGIHPLLGIFLAVIIFIGFSELLFAQLDHAAIVYTSIIVYYLSRFNVNQRNEFLKSTFSIKQYFIIRVVENLCIAFPGISYLLLKQEILFAIMSLLISVIISRINFEFKTGVSFPTPFSKQPFEFTRGSRRSIILIIFSYAVFAYAFYVKNENIAVFSLILLYLLSISYYSESENECYVWIYALSPRKFIFQKLKVSILHSSILASPQLLTLLMIYPEKTILLAGISSFYFLLLFCIIIMKYSEFPGDISIGQGIIFIFCAWFPPLLLGIIPYYYSKSIKNLKALLQ